MPERVAVHRIVVGGGGEDEKGRRVIEPGVAAGGAAEADYRLDRRARHARPVILVLVQAEVDSRLNGMRTMNHGQIIDVLMGSHASCVIAKIRVRCRRIQERE